MEKGNFNEGLLSGAAIKTRRDKNLGEWESTGRGLNKHQQRGRRQKRYQPRRAVLMSAFFRTTSARRD